MRKKYLLKLLLTMKLSFIFMFLTVVHITASVHSQNTVINLTSSSGSFGEIINAIEEQSEFKVFYKNEQINLDRKISLNSKSATVSELLQKSLDGTNIGFTLIDKVIVLSPVNENKQQVVITGKITSSDGSSIPGANVIEKGNISNGTVTDIDGNYTITVSNQEAVLVFSYIGYLNEEVSVAGKTVIDVLLIEDIQRLDEVVVIGYGSAKRSDVTGALSSISSEQIQSLPVTNINQALQGRAAGVDVVTNSFGLNANPTVRIRGNRSIAAGNDPLYVVDGVPINGTINDINTMDVESVEILKDASATAIYGSRGANGVILITTKRGESGKVSINFESSVSVRNSLRFFDDLTGDQWMEIARDNWRGSQLYSSPYPDPIQDYYIVSNMHNNVWESVAMGYEWEERVGNDPDAWRVRMRPTTAEEQERWGVSEVPDYRPENVRTYDWDSEGRNKNALTQNHQFSVSGGGEKITAYFSLGYINEQGLGIGEKYQRISPRLNLDFTPVSWLKIGMSNMFNSELTDPGHGLFWGVTSQIPLSLPYDSTGFLIYPTDDTQLKNPLRDEELNTFETRASRYLGSYYAEISLFKNLKYRLNVSQDFRHWREGRYEDGLSSSRFPSVSTARYRQRQDFHYSIDNLLYYNKEVGVHSIGVTLLQSVEAKRWERTHLAAENLPFPNQKWYDLGSNLNGVVLTDATYDFYERTQLASFMGRINYGLMDKYLLTASLRYDGSSMFYVDNQWDYFPSLAVSWKVHNEAFLQNVEAISQLKLRLGYGTVGQAGNNPYETAGRLEESVYVFGEVPAKGYGPQLIQTREVGWEKTTTTNFGLDFGLLQNRISGTVELYRANTHDLLLEKYVPAITGFQRVRSNIGKTRNEGIEFTLNTVNINRSGFKWETDFIFARNKEQIVELADGAQDDILNGWFIGYPIKPPSIPADAYYNYEYDGIWQVKDSALMDHYNQTGNNGFAPGKIRVKDLNGDDTINVNDRRVIGSPVPKFSGGITNRFSYKGFELSAFVYFRVGHTIYSRDGHYFPMTARFATPYLVDYYKPMGTEEENANAVHPAPAETRDMYERAMWPREASFVKVRYITLAYDLPSSVLTKVKIKSLRLSIQAFNPFLFTDYPFLDPEAQANNAINTPPGTSDKGWIFSLKLGL